MQRSHKIAALWVCAMLCTLGAVAETEFQSRKLYSIDGLACNTIRTMLQDTKGFLWFGTVDGLSQYDGHTFHNYLANQHTSDRVWLKDSRIYNTCEHDEMLWLSTEGGTLSCYDAQRGCFVDFTGCGEFELPHAMPMFGADGTIWCYMKGIGIRKMTMQGDRTFTSERYDFVTENAVCNVMCADKHGQLWVGMNQGVMCIAADGEVTIYAEREKFIGIENYDGVTYFLTRRGNIYTSEGAKCAPKMVTTLPTNKVKITDNLLIGSQWVVLTVEGSVTYDLQKREVVKNPAYEAIKFGRVDYGNNRIPFIYNMTGHIYIVNPLTGELDDLLLIPTEWLQHIDHERFHIWYDSRQIIWITTYGNGLFAYNPATKELEHFTSPNTNGAIASDFLMNVMEDRTGEVWVASDGAGVMRLTIFGGYKQLLPEPSSAFERANAVRMIKRLDSGEMLLTTRQGKLYKMDDQLSITELPTLTESTIYAICEDSQGVFWYGTQQRGLYIGNRRMSKSDSDDTSLLSNKIFALLCDTKGRMWVGTFGGGLSLATYNDTRKRYEFRSFFTENDMLSRVRSLLQDDNGVIWMASNDGLTLFDPDELIEDASRYHHFSTTNGNFCTNEVRTLFQDSQGRMWAGTAGCGLVLCEPAADYSTMRYTVYSTADGLCDNIAQGIAEDEFGNLWISSQYGASRFNPTTEEIESFYFSSLTMGNVYIDSSICKTADGLILMGTNHGITVIDPKHIATKHEPSEIVLTAIWVNGSPLESGIEGSPLKRSPAYTEGIRLKHHQNSITVAFSNFNYNDNNTTVTYWLENYDRKWSNAVAINEVSYKNLEPGHYILHIKKVTTNNADEEVETTLDIVIAHPWWQTWWAVLIYILITLGIAYYAYRIVRTMTILRNRVAVERQMTEFKLVFFTNISHEFRTPLTLIQGALDRMQRQKNIPQSLLAPLATMEKSNRRLQRLINQLLEFRKMQNNKLKLALEETEIVGFLRDIFEMFSETAKEKRMTFSFETSVEECRLFVDRGYIDKVAYNLLSNAFKFTPSEGSISMVVSMDEENKQVIFEVRDNGVGISEEKQKDLFKRFMQSSFSRDSIGVGLHLSHELMEVHKGSLRYRPNPTGGSIFCVTIPTEKGLYDESDFLVAGNALLTECDEKEEVATFVTNDEGVDVPTMKPLNDRKVLVIEDDTDVRNFLKEELSGYFTVETANDGASGLDIANHFAPDLILCDVMMPLMNGMEVTRRLRSNFETSHIPIILLTALDTPEKKLEGISVGADAYITKPFSAKFLLTRIFRLIEQREKLREKYASEPGTMHTTMFTTDRDKEFVERLAVVMEGNMKRGDFSVDEFASLMKLGRTTFYSKVKGLTGYAPVEYMRVMRMKRAAARLLEDDRLTMAQVADEVGINDPFYFSRCFKQQFGISPSAYQKGEKGTLN